MNHINQNPHSHFADLESKTLSLEQVDKIARKCHHLHDEEILLIISRFLTRLKKRFSKKISVEQGGAATKP
ncbi:hypothetical protein [Desulfogranum mediterraneum]|uniref:hypothetical protein n=1 Tax=Desulfogranum mediterraneum TaxID=160661 RepID=UPI000424A7F0|nr:hypothetical protein [Desulfogranum mediterraneum]